MLTSRGLFEAEHSNFSQAAVLLEKALGLDPHYPLALKGLESISRLKVK